MRALLKNERDELVATVERDLERLRARAEQALREAAREFLDRTEETRRTGSDLNQVVRATLRADIDRWRAEEDRRIGEVFREATARFVEETERIVQDTISLCGDVLGVRLSSTVENVDLSPKTGFSCSFFEVPTILESILPDLRGYLPKRLARRLAERDVMDEIPRLVDKHMGRLRYDFVRRLEDSCRALERELVERLGSTIESLRSGVHRAQGERERSAEHARRASEDAHVLRAELDELDRLLLAVRSGSDSGETRGR